MGWKQRVLDVTPNRFHPLMKGAYETFYPSDSTNSESTNPEPEYLSSNLEKLPKKNISNLEALPHRVDLLEKVPQNGKVAELGVAEGDFSRKILSKTSPETLYLIDTWSHSERYDEEMMQSVMERFSEEIESNSVEIIRNRSEVALENFENDFFDWVYIDTTHSYEQTARELELSKSKVKADGVIAGHDYSRGVPPLGLSFGVIPAVHEFCVANDWEISYLTLETDGASSFALKNMSD